MTHLFTYFPPLRQKILRNFLVIILAYGLLGFFLMSGVFLASRLTPQLIHVNYDSIMMANRMKEALQALYHPQDQSQIPPEEWSRQFEKSLQFEEGNITEPGEKEVATEIRKLWESIKKNPSGMSHEEFRHMLAYLDQLVQVNEKGMFSIVSKSHALNRKILISSLLFFLVTFILSFYLADNLASRLATPIKEIAEILRSKPDLQKRLKLPEANTLELSILNRELNELWSRLGALTKLNLDEIVTRRNQLETILSSVEDGILVLDNKGKVVLCNEGMANFLDLNFQDILNQNWRDLPSLNPNYLKLRDFLVPELNTFNSLELSLDGIRMILAARYRPIFGNENQQKGSLYLLHDITQKVQKQRLKEEFISVLSHELKTPLQSLGTAAELLEGRKEKMDENTQILVDTLNEDVSRIRAIANDFIQVGQREIYTLKLRLQKIALNERLQEWIKPFRLLANDRHMEIELHVPEKESVWANLDEIKFPWVISNLLSNAIRLSPPHTKIEINLSVQNQTIHLDVKDEGPGIPQEIRNNIFEPYYQGPVKNGASQGFLGIGLTIAKEVVEAHDGKISYEPRQPTGSVFKIELPVADFHA